MKRYKTTSKRMPVYIIVMPDTLTIVNRLVYVLKEILSTGKEEISTHWNVGSWCQFNSGWRNMRGWSSRLNWYNMRKQGAYIDILNIHRPRCLRVQELNIFIFCPIFWLLYTIRVGSQLSFLFPKIKVLLCREISRHQI